jgi:hypothetical protein
MLSILFLWITEYAIIQRMTCEETIRALFKRKWPNDRAYYNYRPEWLINPRTGRRLELDIYYPSQNLAIEIQGPHHGLMYQEYKDQIKKEKCAARGITLETIPTRNKYLKRLIVKYNLDPKGIPTKRFGHGTPKKNSGMWEYHKKTKRALARDHYARIEEEQRKETERIRNSRLLQNMRECP